MNDPENQVGDGREDGHDDDRGNGEEEGAAGLFPSLASEGRRYYGLDPPMSKGERSRDALLRILDSAFFQRMGILAILGIVGDGALFFFLLMGWHRLCDSPKKTDCDPRNFWYNLSIQILNVFFTYTATVSMPWRCTNFLHLAGVACPPRSNDNGRDLYGQPSEDIWFHIDRPRRLGIVVVLLLNCLTQYANQITRIVYPDFDSQNVSPGNIWTNVFFASSFACAGFGAAWLVIEERKVRASHPDRFAPGPWELFQQFLKDRRRRKENEEKNDDDKEDDDEENKNSRKDGEDDDDGGADGGADGGGAVAPVDEDYQDPTRNRRTSSVTGLDRASMRLFAM